jgi:hypothetical protein
MQLQKVVIPLKRFILFERTPSASSRGVFGVAVSGHARDPCFSVSTHRIPGLLRCARKDGLAGRATSLVFNSPPAKGEYPQGEGVFFNEDSPHLSRSELHGRTTPSLRATPPCTLSGTCRRGVGVLLPSALGGLSTDVYVHGRSNRMNLEKRTPIRPKARLERPIVWVYRPGPSSYKPTHTRWGSPTGLRGDTIPTL